MACIDHIGAALPYFYPVQGKISAKVSEKIESGVREAQRGGSAAHAIEPNSSTAVPGFIYIIGNQFVCVVTNTASSTTMFYRLRRPE